MARGIWAILAKLPPVDFVALAERKRDACRWTKKGDKRPRCDVEKQMAAFKANKRARQEAAADRIYKRLHPPRKKLHLEEKMLLAMAPGQWYARSDLAILAGIKFDSAKVIVSRLMQQGLVERAPNPEYAPTKYRKGVPVHEVARGCDIPWLYTLTTAGEAKRIQWAYLA
jgi:hypothetical protein